MVSYLKTLFLFSAPPQRAASVATLPVSFEMGGRPISFSNAIPISSSHQQHEAAITNVPYRLLGPNGQLHNPPTSPASLQPLAPRFFTPVRLR